MVGTHRVERSLAETRQAYFRPVLAAAAAARLGNREIKEEARASKIAYRLIRGGDHNQDCVCTIRGAGLHCKKRKGVTGPPAEVVHF